MLYTNHGGEDPIASLLIILGFLCQKAITLNREPTKGSKLITPAQVSAVAITVRASNSQSTQRFFLVGLTL